MSSKPDWEQTLWSIENLFEGDVEKFLESESEEALVNSHFGGDRDQFERDRQEARKRALDWTVINTYAEHLPEFQKAADAMIYSRLGYHLDDWLLIPYSPYMRELIREFRHTDFTWEQFKHAADKFIAQIRNKDVEMGGWIAKKVFDAKDYEFYNEFKPEYKEQARKIVSEFLGYAPDLNHSLYIELTIRKCLSLVEKEDDVRYNNLVRSKTITLVKYREIFLLHGKDAADSLPLYGDAWLEEQCNRMLN